MKESVLTSKLIRVMRDRGAWCVKVHGGPTQRGGLPDILCCYRGRFIGVEVKVPGKEHNLTRLQRLALDGIRQANGLATVVSSVAQVHELFDRIDRAGQK